MTCECVTCPTTFICVYITRGQQKNLHIMSASIVTFHLFKLSRVRRIKTESSMANSMFARAHATLGGVYLNVGTWNNLSAKRIPRLF